MLLRWLTPEQANDWRTSHRFTVIGSAGGRYQISRGSIYNVVDLVRGFEVCVRPQVPAFSESDWPVADIVLAQKLSLEHDEPGTMAVANARPLNSGFIHYDFLCD